MTESSSRDLPLPAVDRNLALDVVRVTEASALAAAGWMGRGDERAADQAAAAAMRRAIDVLPITGIIVNGESDDPAHALHTGQKVGSGSGPEVDIVLTALEGPTICAKGSHNALSVVAMTVGGRFLRVPEGVYMEKIAVGPGVPAEAIDLDQAAEETVRRVAEARGKAIADLAVCILDRPRHADLIGRIYESGARVVLIADGDVSGAIATGLPDSGIDLYMGSGGAAEGVLAAAGLKCLGGRMQCRMLVRSDEDRARCRRAGIDEFKRKVDIDAMVVGEVMFAATGITDGHVLKGVRLDGNRGSSHSLVMRSRTGTIRTMTSQHDFRKSTLLPRRQ